MTTYLETAEAIYDSVRATHAALVEVYDEPEPAAEGEQRHRARRIASLHEAIRYGGKAAEVGALLSIARSLEAMNASRVTREHLHEWAATRARLEQERLSPKLSSHVICTCGDWHRRGQACPSGGEVVGDVV